MILLYRFISYYFYFLTSRHYTTSTTILESNSFLILANRNLMILFQVSSTYDGLDSYHLKSLTLLSPNTFIGFFKRTIVKVIMFIIKLITLNVNTSCIDGPHIYSNIMLTNRQFFLNSMNHQYHYEDLTFST